MAASCGAWSRPAPPATAASKSCPASAVRQIGQLSFVQVVRDGRAVRRLVKTGPARDGRVEILSGLRAGETILVNPVQEG